MSKSEEINNGNVFMRRSVQHLSATLGGGGADVHDSAASQPPENELITTSRQLPTDDPDGLSPSSSVIALPVKLLRLPPLKRVLSPPLIHFSPAVFPHFFFFFLIDAIMNSMRPH